MVKREGTCKSCKFMGSEKTDNDSDVCDNPKCKDFGKMKDLFDTDCPDWVDWRKK